MTSVLGGNITVAGAGNVTCLLAEGILATTTNGNGNVLIARNGVVMVHNRSLHQSNGGAGFGT